jgi:hypothetical protein
MWNMPRKGFEELYEQVPGPKPGVEEVWRLTGGNPRVLAQLYEAGWRPEKVVETLAEKKRLALFAGSLSGEEREWLRQAVEDPDTLFARDRIPLMEKLVELNLIVDSVPAQGELALDRPATARKGSRAGRWEARRLANTTPQRGGEKGAERARVTQRSYVDAQAQSLPCFCKATARW